MAGVSTTLRLFLVCTDKGQHARARLGELDLLISRANRLFAPDVMGGSTLGQGSAAHRSHDAAGVTVDRDRDRVELRCTRCGRHVQWRGDTARQVIRAMCAGSDPWREAQLDLSHLP